MNPVKIVAIILVISAGLVGSYFIIKNSTSPLSPSQTQNVSALKPSIQNPLKWVENTVKSLTDNSLVEHGDNIKTENKSTTNLTELVAQSISNGFEKLGQNSQGAVKNFDPQSSEGQELIQETVNNLDVQSIFQFKEIKDSDIKISLDDSRQAQEKYLEKFQDIIQTRFGGLNKTAVDSFNDFANFGDVSTFKKATEVYRLVIDDLLNLETPPAFLEIHKKLINYYQQAWVIYQAISDFQNDSVKAYVAVEYFPQLEENAINVQKLIEEKRKELNL